MVTHLGEGDVAVVYVPKYREYGIRVLNGGTSFVVIDFCPWRGQRLPRNLRLLWFRKIEQLGFEVGGADWDARLPEEYRSEKWWRDLGL